MKMISPFISMPAIFIPSSYFSNSALSDEEKADCFYRGGFFNWFEGGPRSKYLLPAFPGTNTIDGKRCVEAARYCKSDPVIDFWSKCNEETEVHANVTYYKGCYFGRGALQVSISGLKRFFSVILELQLCFIPTVPSLQKH